MAGKWPSRTWSCSEVLRGAAQVVDSMALPAADVVAAKRGLLSETADLDEQQLQALLEASLLLLSCEPCVAFKLFPVDFSQQETEKKIADHQMKGDLHAIVCSLFADTSWTAAAISV